MPRLGPRQGVVAAFDGDKGWGAIRDDDGSERFFHCTGIADGSRTIDEGADVVFRLRAGRLGRWEATDVQRAAGGDSATGRGLRSARLRARRP